MLKLLLDTPLEAVGVDFGLVENRGCQAALLFEQRREQMLHVNLLVAVAGSFGLGRADCFLSLLSKPVDVHPNPSFLR